MRKQRKHVLIIAIILVALCISILPASAIEIGPIYIGNITPPEQDFSPRDAMLYARAPENFYPFIFDGTPPHPGQEIDTEGCVLGQLYVYNKTTELVNPIWNQAVTMHTSTKDHLFFITSDQTIMQTDYSGTTYTAIYQAEQGSITMLNAFGTYLYFVEGQEYAVVLDVANGNVYTVVRGNPVVSAYMFDYDKLIWYDGNWNATYYNISTGVSTTLPDDNAEAELIASSFSLESAPDTEGIQSSVVSNDNVGQPDSYNNVAFPFAEYPAIPERKGYIPTTVLSYFKDSTGTELKYAKAGQCDGFAKYAHDRFWHIMDWSRTVPSWYQNGSYTEDYHGTVTWGESKEQMIAFFQTLPRGSFVRYLSKKKYEEGVVTGNHSYVFDGIDDDGLGTWHYECNQDYDNGVGYQYYTFDLYFAKIHHVYYYVTHTLEDPVPFNASRHKVPCENCDGYLLQPHSVPATYVYQSNLRHTVSYSCCGWTGTEPHLFESGIRTRCIFCGWVDEMIIAGTTNPEIKE